MMTLEEQMGKPKPISRAAYNKTLEIKFDPGKHLYTVYTKIDSWNAVSVTTALGVIDKSGPLIHWAVGLAVDKVRELLIPKLVDGTLNGDTLETVLEQAKKAHRQNKEQAADIGSVVHSWLQIHSRDLALKDHPPLPKDPQAAACALAAWSWFKEHNVTPLLTEEMVYSRKHDYAGTADMLGFVDGDLTLIDYKSSKGVYPSYWLQTAAYAKAIEEENDSFHVEKRIILRLGKDDGKFDPHVRADRDELEADFRAFRAAQILHDHLEILEYIAEQEKQ